MSPKPVAIGCLCLLFVTAAVAQQTAQSPAERSKQRHLDGHSQFGEAFDEGPREKPSRIAGIGATHFPITTKNPEVQMWFDQGNTLLHSFWFYEAERAFRWASKLEPDNPMPYWGLVRSVGGGARARVFMKEATKRKDRASERERAYLDAWELMFAERWDEILKEGSIPWRDQLRDKLGRRYAEAMAYIGKKDRDAAQKAVDDHSALKDEAEKGNATIRRQFEIQDLERRGALALLNGEALDGLRLLTEAAPKELEQRSYYDDPPFYPTLMWSKIGYVYLDQQSPKLAVDAFTKALKAVANDPFSLAGLVVAHHALGENKAAADAMARLEFAWSDAEPGNRWLRGARDTGVKAPPVDRSPAPQRNYTKTTLSQFGPAIWTPFAAPALEVTDAAGQQLTLDQFRGKNVILVFYLGVGCAHCVKQLKDLSERGSEFERLDAQIIAVSQDTPEQNAKSQELGPLKMKQRMNETHAASRATTTTAARN